MVLFPGFTMLDLVGPQNVPGMRSYSHFVASTRAPVPSDSGGAMVPTVTFADAPRMLDILLVPGGVGTNAASLAAGAGVQIIRSRRTDRCCWCRP
jgi:cyclohexyl-isocyanide hydratase